MSVGCGSVCVCAPMLMYPLVCLYTPLSWTLSKTLLRLLLRIMLIIGVRGYLWCLQAQSKVKLRKASNT